MALDWFIKDFVLLRQPIDRVPGPNDVATSITKIIQYLIDNQLISSLNLLTVNILTKNDTTVKARFAGVEPTAALSGDDDEVVTITIPQGCIPIGFKVEGLPDNTDSNDSRTVIFTGAGVPGNTSTADMFIPGIIKMGLTTSFGPPADDNPWTIDFGSPGDADVIGVGTSITPSLSLRINNLNTLTDKHLIQFSW